MHWFWRAAIAVGVGGLAGGVWHSTPLHAVQTWVSYPVGYGLQIPLSNTDLPGWLKRDLVMGVWHLFIDAPPVAISALLTYALLTRRFARKSGDETRCRKCDYILRGITEPRCPECGERI